MDKEVLFVEWKGKALCLICRETVAVLKDFNINRHYETKHNAYGQNISENNQMKKITALHESLQKQQMMISQTCLSQLRSWQPMPAWWF